MIKIRTIYQLSFYILISVVFLVGGILQFFVGIPNTVMTIGLIALMFFNYILYVTIKRKVLFNQVVILGVIYMIIIILSSLINASSILNILLYCLFPLLPLSAYLFFFINKKEGYIKQRSIYKLIFFLATIQLPIILIQSNFYETLITFNNSGQRVASFDFLFGSFLLKSDHSLGCFLNFTIISLLFNLNHIRKYLSHPLLFALYLSLTLLLSESNISKALMVLVWVMYIVKSSYLRITRDKLAKKILIYLTIILIGITAYNFRNLSLITSKVGGTFERHYTVEKSIRFFNEGTAKREQIVIAAVNSLEIKYIGDGAYSYFDIRTGKFKNTVHFSQIIWTYFDLGLIGLIVVFFYTISLLKKTVTTTDKYLFFSILFLFGAYMFYTTPFSEIGLLLSLFLFFNFNQRNELNNNTFSRLEEDSERRI